MAHCCPGSVQRHVRVWRKPTPHSGASVGQPTKPCCRIAQLDQRTALPDQCLHSAEAEVRPSRRKAEFGRVGMWRGGCRLSISVAASFVWRCLSGSAMAPFPHPAHRTGQADLPHPALGQELTLSRATPSAVSDLLSELIGFPISKVLPYVLRLS